MLYLKGSLIETETITEKDTAKAEKFSRIKFGEELKKFLRVTSGGRCPEASCIVPGRRESAFEFSKEPEIFQPRYCSLLQPKTFLDSWYRPLRFNFDHFNTRNWIAIGMTEGNSHLLCSVDSHQLATIYVHEFKSPPEPVEGSLEDLYHAVYRDVNEMGALKYTTEEQCHYFFKDQMTPRLRQFFHLECERGEPGSFVENAIRLELSAAQLASVFKEYHHEVNQKNSNNQLPIEVASKYSRSEAVKPLVLNGADINLLRGESGAFGYSIRIGNARFLRELILCGYAPDKLDLKLLNKSAVDSEYVLHGVFPKD